MEYLKTDLGKYIYVFLEITTLHDDYVSLYNQKYNMPVNFFFIIIL